ncbi:MAG: DNA-binding protein [Myxococcales bacterium]|nr:DNA-binding protein [Myxococcales bacterium]
MRTAEPWVSVDDVAAHVGASRDTIYRWIDESGLPASKVGRFWKLRLSDVDKWIRSGGAAQHKRTEGRR